MCRTALLHAAALGKVGCAKMLVDLGASVCAATPNGVTALHFAAARGSIELLSFLLLRSNIEIDAMDSAGQTSLHLVRNLIIHVFF